MPLEAGTRVGSYEVLGPLGAGGMGEVYRARDLRLQRDVALKILPAVVADDPDRIARFKREALVLASLNHPNIAAIYGLEDSDPSAGSGQVAFRALVLELVDGPTLAEHIDGRALPIDEACVIARHIAEALEAAHAQGIIHRDLKPANVKVTADDKVKVLDFGLAKALDLASGSSVSQMSGDVSLSPTITSPAMTRAGVILGTAAYMAPEQARGKAVDKRADIWAFGCVLYEMLTGRRPFGGDEVTDTLAFVLTKDVDWSALPATTPVGIRRLLRRCLEKDRTHRLADIADARLEIEEALAPPAGDAAPAPISTLAASSVWRSAIPWTVAALAIAAAAGIVVWDRSTRGVAPAPLQTRMNADPGVDGTVTTFALSPDGTTAAIAVVTDEIRVSRLYIRRLNELKAVLLNGTEGATGPFFSPDGRWLAFFAGGVLKKVATTGGAVVTLCPAVAGRGGTWTPDGETIIFQPGSLNGAGPLYQVSAAGGTPTMFTTPSTSETARSDRWPQMLPGGRGVIYTSGLVSAGFNDAAIMVKPLPAGEPKVLHRGGFDGRYLSSGHLIFAHDTTIFAAPFDLDRLELSGPPVPVLDQVGVNTNTGGVFLDVSTTGTVVFLPSTGASTGADAPIVWLDRAGKITPLRQTPAVWGTLRFSPDGRTLAMALTDRNQTDIWTYDWARDTLSKLTFDPAIDAMPAWTPDGRRIAYGSQRAGVMNLYWQRADGTGDAQRLTDSPSAQLPGSWHPNGKLLAFHQGVGTDNKQDILILPIDGDEVSGWKPGTPTEFVGGPFRKVMPMFSPDGKWMAYVSNETGIFEVFVRPFPGPGGKWQISSGGGNEPRWSPTRSELFFSAAGNPGSQIMVVTYSATGDSFRADKPKPWSEARVANGNPIGTYGSNTALHPDGRFAAMPLPTTATGSGPRSLVFIFNFFEELKAHALR